MSRRHFVYRSAVSKTVRSAVGHERNGVYFK
jgi:hypothetical protein